MDKQTYTFNQDKNKSYKQQYKYETNNYYVSTIREKIRRRFLNTLFSKKIFIETDDKKHSKIIDSLIQDSEFFPSLEIACSKAYLDGNSFLVPVQDRGGKLSFDIPLNITRNEWIDKKLVKLHYQSAHKSGTNYYTITTKLELNSDGYVDITYDGILDSKKGDKKDIKFTDTPSLGYKPVKTEWTEIPAINIVFNRRETNWGLGNPVLEIVSGRIDKLDILNSKIIEEIIFKTTSISIFTAQGASKKQESNEAKEIKVKGKFESGVRVASYQVDTVDGDQWTVDDLNTNVLPLSQEYDREELRMFNDLMLPYNGDTRSFQSSKAEKILENQIVEDEINRLTGIVIDVIQKTLLMTIDKIDINKINIEMFSNNSSLKSIILDDPEKGLKLGYTRSKMYSVINDLPLSKSKNLIKQQIEEIKNDPIAFAMLIGTSLPADKMKNLAFMDKKLIEKAMSNSLSSQNNEDKGKREIIKKTPTKSKETLKPK